MKTFFLKMVEENPGEVSTSRVVLFLTFLVTIVLPFATWMSVSLWTRQLVEFPTSLLDFCKWAFASACGMKTVSKYFEK